MDFGTRGMHAPTGDDMDGPALDSITLGQLRSMVGAAPKAKAWQYGMRYEDEDTVFNEIEEFYSYVEMPQVAENLRAWQGSFIGEWSKASFAQRRMHVEVLLESLEHRDTEIRFVNARRLLYVLQGTFAETTSAEHQLHMIIENCKVVRAANGASIIVEALKIASAKHDLLSSLSDIDTRQFNLSAAEKQEFIEEVNTELSVYLGMLYFLIEVFKGDDDFGDELMSLDPPLPVYLFQLVSGMKDKSAKGYPVKKLLLVLWKSMLTCLGGIRELQRVKKVARELADLPSMPENDAPIKSTPVDFESFRQETSIKYPTFAPAPVKEFPIDKVATALSPIPVRPHYHHNINETDEDILMMNQNQYSRPITRPALPPAPLPATPAPSPPPVKTKKQQFQTDQGRPFLFPFSFIKGSSRLVPYAIDEADKLYLRHMHVSLSLYQMWQTREECIRDESGLTANGMHTSTNGQAGADGAKFIDSELGEDELGNLPADIVKLDKALEAAEATLKNAESLGDRAGQRRAKERRDDLKRLRRVETIYSAVFPILYGWVLVLLRLLLATVTAGGNNPPPPSANSNGFNSATDPPPPPQTLEEIDVMRHREITSKAVSAILILTLKWFKVSHVMKFHHLGQLLLDSNCLLLILKMFGLQEVAHTVTARNESPDNNFFRYCYLNFARNAQPTRPEDSMLSPPPRLPSRGAGGPSGGPSTYQNGEEEIELLSDYSWRNFFSSINFVKVMQKLSKGRSHRIGMLVTYKSSAILKRILKVPHPMLQLDVLKLIKSQVPYCGRKWRQSNMKVITSIYLNCRPDLRDEWLTGTEGDDLSEAFAEEQALRTLIKFYNSKRYGSSTGAQLGQGHRRSSSQSVLPMEALQNPDMSNMGRAAQSPHIDADVFPPLRSRVPDPSFFLPYIPEDIAFEEEYEEYLSDLGLSDPSYVPDPATGGSPRTSGLSAWQRLADFAGDVADGISDSESIVSIGELADESRGDNAQGDSDSDSSSVDENLNNWEHMSPKTLQALPKSPAGGIARRSSSGGSGLRPVLPFGLDDGSAVDEDFDEEPEMGPMPTGRTAPFAAGEGGRGVDEVEYLYGE